MIRAEIVLKHKNGWSADAIERALKRELTEAVFQRAEADDAEIVRIQFLGPPPKPRKRTASRPA